MLHWMDSPPKHSLPNCAWPRDFHNSSVILYVLSCKTIMALTFIVWTVIGWNLTKLLAMPHAARRNVNGLSMMAQMKRNKIISVQCLVELEAKPKIKNRYECKRKQLRCKIYYANCRIKRNKTRALNTESSSSDNNCCDHSLHICKKCIQ